MYEIDASSRPALRSTLQPSQMGNFKHQSLRERDRDRDGDKEREKDGNERLRHVSSSKPYRARLNSEQLADKYDRDRLPPPSSRNKDKDSVNSSSSRGHQVAPSSGASRRSDARESGKKKAGESNEDWRRGK